MVRAAAHPGLSGFHAIADGCDACAARIQLAKAADRTLDVQYCIWSKDLTGTLMFAALRDGVRIRVLTNALDATDVTVVHAGYARHRVALLEAGVILYEPHTRRAAAPHRRHRPFHVQSAQQDDRGRPGTRVHRLVQC